MRYTSTVAILMAMAAPAAAQSVDARGAAQLTETLKRYVGQTGFDKGILAITVEGDAYKLTFDPKVLIAQAPDAEQTKLSFDPATYSLLLKPRSDGGLDVSGDMASNLAFEGMMPDGKRTKMQWSLGTSKFSGVYDPKLSYFSSAVGSIGKLSMRTEDHEQTSDLTTAAGSFTSTGTANANGGVDIDARQTLTDYVQTVRSSDVEAEDDFPITIQSPKVEASSTGRGVRTAAFLELAAFLIANPDRVPVKLKAIEPEAKQRLLAAFPLWEKLGGGYSFEQASVETPLGAFGADKIGIDIDMTGMTSSSSIDYAISGSGLKYPDGVAPAWSTPILPTDFSMTVGGVNLNLEGPAKRFVEAMDFTKDPPVSDAISEEIVAQFMSANPKFVLLPSSIRNKDTEITASGEMTFAGGDYVTTATIEASGYDKLVYSVQTAAANDPQAGQVFPVLLTAKGFAKTLPDGKLQWVLDIKADGSVHVNGAMLKGPDPVEAPEEEPEEAPRAIPMPKTQMPQVEPVPAPEPQ